MAFQQVSCWLLTTHQLASAHLAMNPQAAARTNDTAGDGTTTATVLSAAFIAEGMKIVSAGTNPVQVRAVQGFVGVPGVCRAQRTARWGGKGAWPAAVGGLGRRGVKDLVACKVQYSSTAQKPSERRPGWMKSTMRCPLLLL